MDAAVDAGLELTASVFCAIIIALGRGGEWRRCLSVLYEDMPAYGVDPDKFCYNMALRSGGVCAYFCCSTLSIRKRPDQASLLAHC